MNYITIVALIFSVITALISAWNAWNNIKVGKIVLELQLNLMQWMNGRYARLDSMGDIKDRIKRLEEQHDGELKLELDKELRTK